jgi:hypothetical protein
MKTIKLEPETEIWLIICKPELTPKEKTKQILSIVIGEEERECKQCEGTGSIQPMGTGEEINCPYCNIGIIKHPITIKDAIERVK